MKKLRQSALLFLNCRISDMLQKIFISLRGIVWTMPMKITVVLLSWEEACVGLPDIDRWWIVPTCILWTIQKERNFRCLEDASSSVQRIKLNCFALFCFRSNQKYIKDIVSTIDTIVFDNVSRAVFFFFTLTMISAQPKCYFGKIYTKCCPLKKKKKKKRNNSDMGFVVNIWPWHRVEHVCS